MMKLMLRISVVAVLVLALSTATVYAKGNGLPDGQKQIFRLELTAHDTCPSSDPNGRKIFLQADFTDPDLDNTGKKQGVTLASLVKTNKIFLREGDFEVLDGNACDGDGASFQLPAQEICSGKTQAECVDDPTFEDYEVYVRLVGKLGTAIKAFTCAVAAEDIGDIDSGDLVCSTDAVVKVRVSPPKFTNESRALLSICLDTDDTLGCDLRLALFSGELEDFFWNFNTTGRAHAQLVFVATLD